MQLVDGDGQRRLVCRDVVAGGVADEQDRDAGLVEDLGGVHVVRREHRPLAPLALHRVQVGDAHLRGDGAAAAPVAVGESPARLPEP